MQDRDTAKLDIPYIADGRMWHCNIDKKKVYIEHATLFRKRRTPLQIATLLNVDD